jgi:hypothetical protein
MRESVWLLYIAKIRSGGDVELRFTIARQARLPERDRPIIGI